MTQQTRNILVTSALPYANGPIHLGHLVEYIQTDIWVRFQKARGHQITYCCADDAHGTPIMLKAEAENITPQQLIDKVHAEHSRDFAGFMVNFDNFYSTHSPENEKHSQSIYRKLRDNGYISEKVITQAYDPVKNMFLPDRFVKGTCPKCKTADQYGDNCESCGATYSPTDLIDPKSAVSGETPIEKESKHYFFDLPKLESFLKEWLDNADIQPEIKNKMQEWFESGLNNWDISRDAPYWGFRIPDTAEGEEKYFYVWLDAPIGYMASFENFCNSAKNKQGNTAGLKFDDYFNVGSDTEMYHFIGKDIAYFHTLFWPATLQGSGHRTPTGVYCHGFLTVDGAKMSKSRGTFIKAETYLNHLRPEYLRYYFASKLSSSVEDIDLNLEDFKQKNNSDIVGKLVNLASRNAGFIKKRFDGKLAPQLDNPTLFDEAAKIINSEIAELYEKREYAAAMRKIMQLADRANEYIDAEKPWVLAKADGQDDKLHAVCTTGINLFYQLIVALQPVLPQLAEDAFAFLNIDNATWGNAQTPLTDHAINKFKPLAQRIEDQAVTAMIEEEKAAAAKVENNTKAENDGKGKKSAKNQAETTDSDNEFISIDDFAKLDLRVAEVLECNHVEGAEKLLQFQLDVGELGKRQVFSGIKKYYPEPEKLVGRKVVLVANLTPRKMRFGLSEGMILSSENKDGLYLMPADDGATAGDCIK